MKKVLLVMFAFLLFTSVVQAAEKPIETKIQGMSILIDEALTITKYDDGRVAPVSNYSKLSLNQINRILSEMKVPNDKIDKLSIDTKRMIISKGGVAVELHNEKTEQYYHSLDGSRYLVTDENKKEILEIQKSDKLTQIKKNDNGISPYSIDLGSDSDGKWSAFSILFYAGERGTNYEYDLFSEYSWSSSPNFYYSDVIAQSWGDSSEIVSGLSTGANNWRNMISNKIEQDLLTIQRDHGITQGEINLKNSSRNYGVLHDELLIPKRLEGDVKMIKASYVHPHKPQFIRGVLEIIGITWPDSLNGDEWHWDGTFVVGDT